MPPTFPSVVEDLVRKEKKNHPQLSRLPLRKDFKRATRLPPTPSFERLPRFLPARGRSCRYLLAPSRTGISSLLLTQKNTKFYSPSSLEKNVTEGCLQSLVGRRGSMLSARAPGWEEESDARITGMQESTSPPPTFLLLFIFWFGWFSFSRCKIAFLSYSLRLKYNCFALS